MHTTSEERRAVRAVNSLLAMMFVAIVLYFVAIIRFGLIPDTSHIDSPGGRIVIRTGDYIKVTALAGKKPDWLKPGVYKIEKAVNEWIKPAGVVIAGDSFHKSKDFYNQFNCVHINHYNPDSREYEAIATEFKNSAK